MTGPAADAQATVQAVQENAQRLGLVWTRKRATVTAEDPPMVVLDGDTEPIAATSMVGPLGAGQRVYVDVVPPSGNFVSGIYEVEMVRARAIGFALAVGGFTVVNWTTLDDNVGGWGTIPTTSFVVPVSGVYAITAMIVMNDPGAVGSLQSIAITVGASRGWPAVTYTSYWSLTGAGENNNVASATVWCDKGSTIMVFVRQNSAGSTPSSAYLTAVRV
jgi:hypothetical protein